MKAFALPLAALAAFALPTAAPAASTTGAPSAIAAQQFQAWNAALQTGEPQKVAALYCEPGGVLIPTVSNRIRTDRAGITNYFEYFLKMHPNGRIDTSFVRAAGPGVIVAAGIYTFRLVKDGKPQDVRARYTFVYQTRRDGWCILEQHSSALPEPEAH